MLPNDMIEMLKGYLIADDEVEDFATFWDAGLLTRDDGLVVEMADGSQFQITITNMC